MPITEFVIGHTDYHLSESTINIRNIPQTKIMTFAEYCPTGSFGPHCENRCHCSDRLSCNRTTGICQNEGCELGWEGAACIEGTVFITKCPFTRCDNAMRQWV